MSCRAAPIGRRTGARSGAIRRGVAPVRVDHEVVDSQQFLDERPARVQDRCGERCQVVPFAVDCPVQLARQ